MHVIEEESFKFFCNYFCSLGGLAAPALIAGLSYIGITSSTILLSSSSIMTLFGAGGTMYSGLKMIKRTKDVSEFDILKIDLISTSPISHFSCNNNVQYQDFSTPQLVDNSNNSMNDYIMNQFNDHHQITNEEEEEEDIDPSNKHDENENSSSSIPLNSILFIPGFIIDGTDIFLNFGLPLFSPIVVVEDDDLNEDLGERKEEEEEEEEELEVEELVSNDDNLVESSLTFDPNKLKLEIRLKLFYWMLLYNHHHQEQNLLKSEEEGDEMMFEGDLTIQEIMFNNQNQDKLSQLDHLMKDGSFIMEQCETIYGKFGSYYYLYHSENSQKEEEESSEFGSEIMNDFNHSIEQLFDQISCDFGSIITISEMDGSNLMKKLLSPSHLSQLRPSQSQIRSKMILSSKMEGKQLSTTEIQSIFQSPGIIGSIVKESSDSDKNSRRDRNKNDEDIISSLIYDETSNLLLDQNLTNYSDYCSIFYPQLEIEDDEEEDYLKVDNDKKNDDDAQCVSPVSDSLLLEERDHVEEEEEILQDVDLEEDNQQKEETSIQKDEKRLEREEEEKKTFSESKDIFDSLWCIEELMIHPRYLQFEKEVMNHSNNSFQSSLSSSSSQNNSKLFPLRVPYDIFVLRYETDLLLEMGQKIKSFLLQASSHITTSILQNTVFTSLISSLFWPYYLIKLCDSIDNEWTRSEIQTKKCGILLAHFLINNYTTFKNKPLTIVSYSIGCFVIFSCLQELKRLCDLKSEREALNESKNEEEDDEEEDLSEDEILIKDISSSDFFGMISTVVIMGSPTTNNPKEWIPLLPFINNRLINCYSQYDLILALIYRYERWKIRVAGTSPISVKSTNYFQDANLSTQHQYKVINLNVSDDVKSHLDYQKNMKKILKKCNIF